MKQLTQDQYKSLYSELNGYEKRGIVILVDGDVKSPLQAVQQFMADDIGNYMRDYITDDSGNLEALGFDYVSAAHTETQTPAVRQNCYEAYVAQKKKRTSRQRNAPISIHDILSDYDWT